LIEKCLSGDDYALGPNGIIIDAGGPANGQSAPAATPTLNEWMLALLVLLLFGFGAQRVRRTR
jgi:hypothetical protein